MRRILYFTFARDIRQAMLDWNAATPEQRAAASRTAKKAADDAERRCIERWNREHKAKKGVTP